MTGGHPLDHLQTVDVERAAMDLRRGLPIVLCHEGGAILVASAETLAPRAFEAVTGWAAEPPFLLLTHQRAATLKIRLYTENVIGLPLSPEWSAADIARLSDPAHDLDRPLAGPFDALRTLPKGSWGEAIRLVKIAGLLPSALVATLPAGMGAEWAAKARLSSCDASAVEAYDTRLSTSLEHIVRAQLPVDGAEDGALVAFRSPAGGPDHFALVIGNPQPGDDVLVRLHSECFTGDLLGSLKCDCGEQLRGAIHRIAEDGKGILLYLAQEGRGIGMMNKLRAYALQDQGFDTVEANERLGFDVDERLFEAAAQMLKSLGHTKIRLLTNNPKKLDGLTKYGITIAARVPHAFAPNPHNADYLRVKAEKTGHDLP